MKKKLTAKRGTIPKDLTDCEHTKMLKCFDLPGWQFDSTILPQCCFIQEPIIEGHYSKTEEGGVATYKSVLIYGLLGMNKKTNEREVVNFFVRYGDLLYQYDTMQQAMDLIDILRKYFKRTRYEEEKELSKKSLLKVA